jgi:hypothetical protein
VGGPVNPATGDFDILGITPSPRLKGDQ